MLKSVYKDVRDIDLYIGLLHERKDVSDSVVGKTLRLVTSTDIYRQSPIFSLVTKSIF